MEAIKCILDEPFIFDLLKNNAVLTDSDILKCFEEELLTPLGNSFNHKYFYYTLRSTKMYLKAINNNDYIIKRKVEIEDEIKKFTKYLNDISFFKAGVTYNYFSLGCGEGKKDKDILQFITDKLNTKVNYIPIDFSFYLLRTAICRVKTINKEIPIFPFNLDFNNIGNDCKKEIAIRNCSQNPSIFALLGNTIGNYSENILLSEISSIMKPDDYLLIGYKKITNENKANVTSFVNSGDRDFLKPPLIYLNYPSDDLNDFTLVPDLKAYEDVDKNDTVFSKVVGSKSIFYCYNEKLILSFSTRYIKNKLIEYCGQNFNLKQVEAFNKRPDSSDKYGSILFKRCEDLITLIDLALKNIVRFWESDKAYGIDILRSDLTERKITDTEFIKQIGDIKINKDDFVTLLNEYTKRENKRQ